MTRVLTIRVSTVAHIVDQDLLHTMKVMSMEL